MININRMMFCFIFKSLKSYGAGKPSILAKVKLILNSSNGNHLQLVLKVKYAQGISFAFYEHQFCIADPCRPRATNLIPALISLKLHRRPGEMKELCRRNSPHG